MIAAAIATGVVFAATKLWVPAGDAYRFGLAALQWPFRVLAAAVADTALPALGRARLTADPTDLIVLPALIAPVWLARRGQRGSELPEATATATATATRRSTAAAGS